MEADLGFKNIRSVQEGFSNDDPADLKKSFEKGMVMDFKTLEWQLNYYPTDWSHFRVIYSARARLIRMEDSKITWQAFCNLTGEEPEKPRPTMDQLKENNYSLLKEKLNVAAEQCAHELIAQFSGKETNK